jgi:hypothetical protein
MESAYRSVSAPRAHCLAAGASDQDRNFCSAFSSTVSPRCLVITTACMPLLALALLATQAKLSVNSEFRIQSTIAA